MKTNERMSICSTVVWELRDKRGRLKCRRVTKNLVTDVGDIYAASKMFSAPTAMAGMKLGSASTAAAKNGAGSYIGSGDYISGSAKAFDATWPKAGAANNIVQFKRTYAAGEGTGTVRRAAIVDNTTDAAEADATHTFAITVEGADIPKGASDTLTITWNVTFLGA